MAKATGHDYTTSLLDLCSCALGGLLIIVLAITPAASDISGKGSAQAVLLGKIVSAQARPGFHQARVDLGRPAEIRHLESRSGDGVILHVGDAPSRNVIHLAMKVPKGKGTSRLYLECVYFGNPGAAELILGDYSRELVKQQLTVTDNRVRIAVDVTLGTDGRVAATIAR